MYYFKCNNLLAVSSGSLDVYSNTGRLSKVVSLRHNSQEVKYFDDLLNLRDNYLDSSLGAFIETISAKGACSHTVKNNLEASDQILRSHAHNNNIDYVYLKFAFEGEVKGITLQAMDNIIYANFMPAWEVNDKSVLNLNDVSIVEAQYCQPISGNVLEGNE